MRANGLMFEAVDDDEKMNLEKDLMTVGVPSNMGSFATSNISNVRWDFTFIYFGLAIHRLASSPPRHCATFAISTASPHPSHLTTSLTPPHHLTTSPRHHLQQTDFFKVPFAQALDLVAKRKVLVKGGMAYVPSSNVTSIVVARFRTNLSKVGHGVVGWWGGEWKLDTLAPPLAPILYTTYFTFYTASFRLVSSFTTSNHFIPTPTNQSTNPCDFISSTLHTTPRHTHIHIHITHTHTPPTTSTPTPTRTLQTTLL